MMRSDKCLRLLNTSSRKAILPKMSNLFGCNGFPTQIQHSVFQYILANICCGLIDYFCMNLGTLELRQGRLETQLDFHMLPHCHPKFHTHSHTQSGTRDQEPISSILSRQMESATNACIELGGTTSARRLY